jgi:hypothetical protein
MPILPHRDNEPLIDRNLIGIYLTDHLAGSQAGLELAKRARGANEGGRFGRPLAELVEEIESDREALLEVMAALNVKPVTVKQLLAWSGEKLGRLKLNGQLRGYSPLSRVLELEGLLIGVSGKLQLWRTLAVVARSDDRLESFDFAALATRAQQQRSRLEDLHDDAAGEAFGAHAASLG